MGLSGAEVANHNNKDDCWVIVHGKAYDVTEFMPEHPGGPKIILKYAGKDATEEYEVRSHTPSISTVTTNSCHSLYILQIPWTSSSTPTSTLAKLT